MADEYVNKHPDPIEKMFSQLEAQVVDIIHNANLLMLSMSNKLGIFREDGVSNIEDILEGRLRHWEETKN